MTVYDFIKSVPMMSGFTPKQIEFINNYIPSHLTRLNWSMDSDLNKTNIPIVINIIKKINIDIDNKEIIVYPKNNRLTQIKTNKLQFNSSELFNINDSIINTISDEVNSIISNHSKILINNLLINMERDLIDEIIYITVYWRIGYER